jgi:NADH:ubiquinone oxidoreductase subunit
MALQVRGLAAEQDDLSSIPRAYAGRRNLIFKRLPSESHMPTPWHAYVHTHMYILYIYT